jgi:hypothetical protein
MIPRGYLSGLTVVLVLTAVSPAWGQRRPTIPPGQAKRAQQVPSTSALVSASAAPSVETVDVIPSAGGRVRSLGAWLDDTSALQPGEAWLALSITRWKMPIATGTDAPVVDASIGLTPRVQASITVPYFRVTDRDGGNLSGLGDFYLGTKVVLRDAASHTVGVAVGPTLELLSQTSITNSGFHRVNWILPISIERRFNFGRVYGSGGYFTRGVLFATGAFEYPASDRLVVSAAATHAYSTDGAALSEQVGLSRRRIDVSGTAAYTVSPALAVFGSLGRSIWGLDDDSTRLLASIGVSVNVTR